MILVYPGTESKNIQKIKEILKDYPIGWMGDEHKEQQMAVLADQAEKGSLENEHVQGMDVPFIYFAKVPVKEVGRIQKEMEEAGLPIHSMAIETENNRSFQLGTLMEEVDREAKYFQKRDELADLIMQADPARMEKDEDYFKCHLMAAGLLKEAELSEKMLDTAIGVLKSLQDAR